MCRNKCTMLGDGGRSVKREIESSKREGGVWTRVKERVVFMRIGSLVI